MECLNIALDAKRAFEAQRGRRVSRHEELHALINHNFLHDFLLVAFYSNFIAYGEYDLAVIFFSFLMDWHGYEVGGDEEESAFRYVHQQYINTDGLANLDKFVEQEDWRYEG